MTGGVEVAAKAIKRGREARGEGRTREYVEGVRQARIEAGKDWMDLDAEEKLEESERKWPLDYVRFGRGAYIGALVGCLVISIFSYALEGKDALKWILQVFALVLLLIGLDSYFFHIGTDIKLPF